MLRDPRAPFQADPWDSGDVADGAAGPDTAILLVDDRPSTRAAVEAALEGTAARLVVVTSGVAALAVAEREMFALALLTVGTPGVDGLETARAFRAHPRAATTPVVFFAGDGDARSRASLYAAGAVDVLVAPFDVEVLRVKLAAFAELGRWRLRDARRARAEAGRREAEARRADLQALVEQAPVGVATWEGPEHTYRFVNAAYARLFDGRPLIGRSLREAFPELPEATCALWDHVYRTGEPSVRHQYRADYDRGGGSPEEAYFTFLLAPLRRASGQVYGVVAVAVEVTELELAGRRVQRIADELAQANAVLAAVLKNAPVGVATFDRSLRYTEINDALASLNGLSREAHLGRTIGELFGGHPNEPTLTANLERVVSEGVALTNVEVTWGAGGEGYALASYYPLRAGGEVVGAAALVVDLSERRRIERERATSEARARRLQEAGNIGVAFWEGDRIVDANEALCRMLGRPREAFRRGDVRWDAITPPEYAPLDARALEEAARSGASASYEKEYLRADGRRLPVLLAIARWEGESEAGVAWIVDVTERRRAERGLALLAGASGALAASLDYGATLGAVARVAVPDFADWCAVDLCGEGSSVERVALAHADPATLARGWQIERRHPVRPEELAGTQVARLTPALDEAWLARVTPSVEHARAVRDELGLHSTIAVPLVARGRVLGRMVFALAETPRPFDEADLALAEQLAGRAAIAVDNARLHREAQEALAREQKARVEAETARAQAEGANRMKDEFLATVSHELRTPLNAMLGWASLLRGGTLDGPGRERALETIERNARAQARLIEDLLDVSRILQGKFVLSVGPVELVRVVEAALDAVRPAADAKGIRLQPVLDSHATIVGDAERLQQVAWNLLSNAIKFTPKGGRVQVVLQRAHSYVELSVADTGQGIEPDFLPHVFEPFRQADGGTTRRAGGLGLGLSIVRSLVELHGGTVVVRSDGPGQGATFVVRLPMAPLRADRAEPAAEGPARATFACPPALAGLRVLVVDDEPDTRALLAFVLGQCEALVSAVGSAAEAYDELCRGGFDLLVSDVGMPGEDGLSLLRRVRQLPPGSNGRIPAIALTAYARGEDRARALRAGFSTHLAKPIEPNELVLVAAALTRGGRA